MRLLLAEDDLDLVAILKKDLEAAGYAVDVADNGIDAEYLGNEAIYDVAVLDLGLPGRNGIEVLNNWRAKGNKLPVIVLTARNAWHERVEGFKVGADDYLGKPFHVEELLARLTALLHRTNQQPGGTLRVCDLGLDEERQTVEGYYPNQNSLTTYTIWTLIKTVMLSKSISGVCASWWAATASRRGAAKAMCSRTADVVFTIKTWFRSDT
ncbi:MAG: transcriptional regulator [Gammaproteobacteria bacterium]|nr:transcriptional regulator [Gammaproteobacteria bacterium]